ncbi:alpha/beta fold hydrolase [Saccharothrix syringae]|uniref:Alpha/beta fold hydrolase n=1 Tax=Saccharothrix syringae TaxID=103733 RepID=A0A5Q0HF77_SACSY|nr:alpha/beta fold hydrolase [Saccharothrix syringae]QFZ24615.1 alpha/beta fold hydrolase [Saccharothrix syringae]
MRWQVTRSRGTLVALGAVVAVLLAATGVWVSRDGPTTPSVKVEEGFVEVAGGVSLETSLFLPERTPAPAVLLAHGFGGDKHSVDTDARELAEAGFIVQTYSARGFGRSTGRIGLNDPGAEVADARYLVDRLAARPDVVLDGPGDPRIAVSGASYGGSLSLLLAGTDRRIDALVPVITYNDLVQGLLPNAASERPSGGTTPASGAFAANGVFKSSWAGFLYSMGVDSVVPSEGTTEPASLQVGADLAAVCGRFTEAVCRAWTELATTGAMGEDTLRLLRTLSPASVTSSITAPTLLVQGEQDTLFGLDQADANARQITAAGGDVQVVWFAGGHDGAYPDEKLRARIVDWLEFRLMGTGANPFGAFEYDVQGGITPEGAPSTRTVRADSYPGLRGGATERRRLELAGGEQVVITPPGGLPAAISGMPALNGRLAQSPLASLFGMDLPGQQATFTSAPLDGQLLAAGSASIRLRVSAVGPPGEGVLFVKVFDRDPNGTRALPGNAVAPVRLPPLPADGSPVEVTVSLAGIVRPFDSGHELQVSVATTDQTYRTPTVPASYRVSLAGSVEVPVVAAVPIESSAPVAQLLGIAGVLGAALLLALVVGFRRRRVQDFDPALAGTPLVISDLSKSYTSGFKAVDGLSFRVERGQVLGLLGPNGAGKTTTLRMLMGLITPTGGTIRVFGRLVTPGAPVLARIGSFVESAGFLPHLSGLENLRAHWAATGRPAEQAHLEEALEIAGLGDAVHRPARTYSQGMRQRLAIAQAMLGLPDLLVLDEPANGLDPPQIHAMREVLRRYAATGRTVLVSSHLLAEVEQTASHVVVVHHGRVIASGAVDEIAAAGGAASFAVDRPEVAALALGAIPGVSDVVVDGDEVHANLNGVPCGDAVAALVGAGVSVGRAGPRRRLEDAFLQLVGEGS